MFEFIPTWLAAALLVVGVLGLVFKNKISNMVGGLGSFLGLKTQTTLIVVAVIGILAGGFGVVAGLVDGGSTATIVNEGATQVAAGALTLKLSDGTVNVTTTSDYYNDAEDVVTFYVADANIIDGEEIAVNVTIQRQYVSEDANVKLTCNAPDLEIDGITPDNLIEKTSGQIDLDYLIISSGLTQQTHSDDNTAWTYVPFSEGDGTEVVTIKFDHDETYEDGMTPYDEEFYVNCDADGTPVTIKVLAAD